MDYKKLCIELFGTSDPKELETLAKKLHTKSNPRNAGRKRKLSNEQIDFAKKELAGGKSTAAIAKELETSVQVLGRYLKEPMHPGCTMRIEYMHRSKICSIIDVDFKNEKVYVINRTNRITHRAFGVIENPTWDDFNWLLENRCFERGRAGLKDILKSLGIDHYDPLAIAEALNGRTAEDDLWMRFTYRGLVK